MAASQCESRWSQTATTTAAAARRTTGRQPSTNQPSQAPSAHTWRPLHAIVYLSVCLSDQPAVCLPVSPTVCLCV